jgi:hypothetical protein
MWNCIKGCVANALPAASAFTVAMIVAAIVTAGAITLGGAAVIAVVGIGAGALGLLLGCVARCI